VVAVAAFAVPSELAEDEVMVSVQVRPGSVVSPAELVRHCASDLPVFAQPRYVDLVASLPTTSNGKVRKSELRAQGVTMSTWDRESA
jgi:carnitine-CoA ligase